MRNSLILLAAAAGLLAAPAFAKPPREESPAPREILAQVGGGNSDAELAAAIAAAGAHPLGTAANPIRVAGPEGAQAYVARLRCSDGSEARIGQSRDGGIGAYGSVLRLYPVNCGNAAPGRVDLLVDIYHEEHVETRAPAGFRLRP
jgi:hypothetical protein